MSREQFVDVVRETVLSLPQDMKAVLRIVEDPEIDDESRVAAAGALLFTLSSANAIPGLRGLLAWVDDALVLRLVLERIAKKSPAAMARHLTESPELLGPLPEQMKTARAYLGELMTVLERAADDVAKATHEGHNAAQCVTDSESGTWLYDEVHGAIVEKIDFSEDEVARVAKTVDQVVQQLRQHVGTRGT
jgi:uncharacterized membrane protein YkvA (DUF1232 family)